MREIKEIYTCDVCGKKDDECKDYEFILRYLKEERLFEMFGLETTNFNPKSKHMCHECATVVDKFFRVLK